MLKLFKNRKSKYPHPSDLVERDGVHFLTGKTAPFSGQIEFTHEEEITLEHLHDPRVMLVNFRMEFLHGKLNGTTIETLEDGTAFRRYTHRDGVREGPYYKYSVDGVLEHEANYKDNQLHGLWRSFFVLGGDSAIHEEGSYKNGEKNGIWKRYSLNGVVASFGQYKEGEKCGQWEYFDDETGNKTRIEILQNDKVIKSLYFSNGVLRDGEHKHFSHDGSLNAVENYKNGIPHGKFTDFDDGAVWRTRWFKDGALHGRVETFDKDGKLEEVSIFENGKAIT